MRRAAITAAEEPVAPKAIPEGLRRSSNGPYL
jgi:hypothetical protein